MPVRINGLYNHMRRRIFIFLAIIFLSATAIVSITYLSLLGRLWNSMSNGVESSLEQVSADMPTVDSGQGFTHEGDQYVNTLYGFSFVLHSDYKTQSNSVGEGAEVFTFDAGEGKSFQIFVMPYDEPAITPERIRIDIPDIIMNNIRTATLDGADALVFESVESSLGETYEIWFAHGERLYQITTYIANEKELNNILQTWKFVS